MSSSKPAAVFDKRVIQRNLKRAKVSRKEYEQYLASLDDVANKAVSMFKEEEPPSPDRR
jgi:hypothetical protein